MDVKQLKKEIIEYSKSIGIDKIGFATADPFLELKNRLLRQQELNYQSGFEESNIEKRVNPSIIFDRPQSIISIALAYPSKMKKTVRGKKEKEEAFFAGHRGERTTMLFYGIDYLN